MRQRLVPPIGAVAPVAPRENGDDAVLKPRCNFAAVLEQAQAEHLSLHVVAHGLQLAGAHAVHPQHTVAAAAENRVPVRPHNKGRYEVFVAACTHHRCACAHVPHLDLAVVVARDDAVFVENVESIDPAGVCVADASGDGAGC